MRQKCWRYVSATCTVAATISSFGFCYYKWKLPILPPVNNNNVGKFDFHAIQGLEDFKKLKQLNLMDETQIRDYNLCEAGWCALAIENDILFNSFLPKTNWIDEKKKCVATLLTELNLDAQWYLVNICTEEDLYCQETSPLTRDSSKHERLIKLLRVLLFNSEFQCCDDFVKRNILLVLYRVLEEFRFDNVEITMITLKILSNIALKSKIGAEQICQTPMLKLLHSLMHQPIHEAESILAHKICMNVLYSLGVLGSYSLLPGIYELHRPKLEVEPFIDVVFVHGLRGTAFRTWRQRDGAEPKTTLFWPKEWLAQDICRPVRLLAVDYSSRILKLGTVMETISMRSKKFQHEFDAAGIGKKPVIFVCHSMGGLLVKHLLINNENLLKQTIGILFMSTPHRGSPLAGYVYKLLRPSDDLRLLREDSEINLQLDVEFKKLLSKIPIFVTVLETRETPLLGTHHLIVPQLSGIFDTGSVYHVDAHHHHICKPKNRNSNIYGIVLNFIKDAIRYIDTHN